MIKYPKSLRKWTGNFLFIFALFLIGLFFTHSDSVQGLERAGLRLALGWMPESALRSKIAVMAIDEPSIKAYGPWPWPRDRIGRAVRNLQNHDVNAIGISLPLDRSQTPPALADLKEEIEIGKEKLKTKLTEIKNRPKTKNKSTLKARKKSEDKMKTGLEQLETTTYWINRLDSDRKLALELSKGRNIILPSYYAKSLSFQPLPPSLENFVVPESTEATPWYLSPWLHLFSGQPDQYDFLRLEPPYGPLSKVATGIGGLPDTQRDKLGAGLPLLLRIDDKLYPSFPLLLSAYALGYTFEDITAEKGQGIRIGEHLIRTSTDYTYFPSPLHLDENGKPAFPVYSIADLIQDDLGKKTLKDFTILIGHTSELTSLEGSILVDAPPVILNAYNTAAIIEGNSVEQPPYFYVLQRGLMLLLAVYLVLLPKRLHQRPGGLLVSTVLALLMFNFGIAVILAGQLWLPMVVPALFLIISHILLSARFHITVAISDSKQQAVDAFRELAANYHSQGLLDQAFSEFKKCTPDYVILDPLYQLGLDFERKRLFTRALAVYQYMTEIDKDYRDIPERMRRLDAGSGPSALGTMISDITKHEDTLLIDSEGIEKPMLGRYIVEKQLGKGAMGTVYLGRDSKIGRKVAIKTLPFNQEFEGKDLEEVKWRFYREAEASGRLDHNNIITIYDVGEEHDLAYIAMDYAQGASLDKYSEHDSLLPLVTIARLGQKIANALAYAHRKHVVHRDVKPANIIFDQDSGSLKITDFGIASLVDDNKTRTGTLLGTPSYMSPEQVAGEKVDGRADIYALGVTMYQLLTGHLPFVGDTLANLMYQITNNRQQGILELRPELTPCLSFVVNKAMEKDPEARFQTGDEMAEALRQCELELNKRAEGKNKKAS